MFIYKAHLKTASADQSAVHIKSVNQKQSQKNNVKKWPKCIQIFQFLVENDVVYHVDVAIFRVSGRKSENLQIRYKHELAAKLLKLY